MLWQFLVDYIRGRKETHSAAIFVWEFTYDPHHLHGVFSQEVVNMGSGINKYCIYTMDPIVSKYMLWLLLCEQSTGEETSLIMTMKQKRMFLKMKIILTLIHSVMILTMNQMRKLFIFLKATHSHKKRLEYKVTGSSLQPMMACWPLVIFYSMMGVLAHNTYVIGMESFHVKAVQESHLPCRAGEDSCGAAYLI